MPQIKPVDFLVGDLATHRPAEFRFAVPANFSEKKLKIPTRGLLFLYFFSLLHPCREKRSKRIKRECTKNFR